HHVLLGGPGRWSAPGVWQRASSMIDTPFRQRPLFLLAAVVLAQVMLLAFQIKRDHDVRLIRYWAAFFVMPFERGGTDAVKDTGGIWSNYISLRGAHAE